MTIHGLLTNTAPAEPILPVAHVTRFGTFKEFLRANTLPLNSVCPLKTRPAIYLFYGAPFYRLPHYEPYELSIDDADEYPIGILIPADRLNGLMAEVYPFDTGALMKGFYSPVFESDSSVLNDYRTHSSSASDVAARLVNLFYGTNLAYVSSKVGSRHDTNELGKIFDLYSAQLKADSRRCAIEIIAFDEIPANWADVVVIGPRGPLRSLRQGLDFLENLVSSGQVSLIEYPETGLFSPSSDCRAIMLRAFEWLEEHKFLPEAS